jgi:predicted glycosyltransferase
MKSSDKVKTSFNPAGFIEQVFIGNQTPDSVISAVEELVRRAKMLKTERKPVLILADVTKVPKIDISGKMAGARKQAVAAMATAEYDKVAVYGNVAVQIMVNTLVLIAGKRNKVRVFGNRVEALKWLKSGG